MENPRNRMSDPRSWDDSQLSVYHTERGIDTAAAAQPVYVGPDGEEPKPRQSPGREGERKSSWQKRGSCS